MQLVEYSVLGLRSARHVLASPDHAARVVLYPMIHVGTEDYFRAVEHEASLADTVIYEGVNSRIVRRITRSYRWLRPERFGLIVQPRMEFGGSGARALSGDLKPSEFDGLWRNLPIIRRMAFEGAAAGMGLWQRGFTTRERLGRAAATDLVPRRRELLSWSPETAGLSRVIEDARDERLWQVLSDEIGESPGKPRVVAVVFGALHMRSVVQRLNHLARFRSVESTWIEVFPA